MFMMSWLEFQIIHFYLSKLQGITLDFDFDEDDDDNNDNDYPGMEYNATVYDGGKNSVAAVHLSRLADSSSRANVAASIAPDLSTFSRNGLIAAANETLRAQIFLECEVATLQQTMLSMRNQSQINSSAISGYQEGALWANHWLKGKGRISASLVLSWFIMLSKKYSGLKSRSFC